MNRHLIACLVASIATFAGPALADDITIDSQPFGSSATRAEVRAELLESRAEPDPWSIAYDPFVSFESGRTRAEVRAETIASRDEMFSIIGEDSGSFALAESDRVDARLASVAAERVSTE